MHCSTVLPLHEALMTWDGSMSTSWFHWAFNHVPPSLWVVTSALAKTWINCEKCTFHQHNWWMLIPILWLCPKIVPPNFQGLSSYVLRSPYWQGHLGSFPIFKQSHTAHLYCPAWPTQVPSWSHGTNEAGSIMSLSGLNGVLSWCVTISIYFPLLFNLEANSHWNLAMTIFRYL